MAGTRDPGRRGPDGCDPRGRRARSGDQAAQALPRRYAAQAGERNAWVVRLAVVAVLPGIPTAVVFAAAGWTGMRLATFLLLDLVGAVVMTAVLGGLGHGLGQRAVDTVLTIDRHASAVSLTMIALALLVPVVKGRIRRRAAE